MTCHTSRCPTENTTTPSVVDSAATVWAVLASAEELPATPERREELAAARARLNDYLAAAGLSEDDLRCHLVATQRANIEDGQQPPESVVRRRGKLRLVVR